jgi:hypothetical protein
MLWDADTYSNSALHWVIRAPHEQIAEQLYFRGIYTSFVFYVPAYLSVHFFEPTSFGTYLFVFVMIQNALVISWMSAYVLPRIVGLIAPSNRITVLTTSILGFYLLESFVPYTLMDLWAVALIMPTVYLIHSKSVSALLCSGLLIGVCLNIRPSYLFAIFLLIGSALIINKKSVLIILPGFFVAQIPQIIYNYKWYKIWSIFPKGLGSITSQLATYASYSIRYDTVAYGIWDKGGLSFCDQKMMALALKVKPQSTFETVLLFIRHPASSFAFIVKKLAAAFWWPVTVPYYEHNPVVNTVFGSLVLFIVTFGFSKIIQNFVRSKHKKNSLGLFALAIGFVINVVLYSNETRYGLAVVLLSVCGFATIINNIEVQNGRVYSPAFLRKENVVTLILFICLLVIATLTLVGEFGFQSIKNCG